MRRTTLASLTGAIICFIPLLAHKEGVSHAQSQRSATNAPAAATQSKIGVVVFFGTNKVMTAEEIRSVALATLLAKGHRVREDLPCGINVSVADKEIGCSVNFLDLEQRLAYAVNFDKRGEPSVFSAGPMGHRTPKMSDPVGPVPEGAVRVK